MRVITGAASALGDVHDICAEAQKAAWLYDDINDACPYPFGSLAGVMFKEAFLAAQQQQRAATATTRSTGGQA